MVHRSVQTLQRWDRVGLLPTKRSPANRRYYTHDDYLKYIGQKATTSYIVTYCRVSGAAQKEDLKSQKAAVELFCINSGRAIGMLITDVGSGLNYKRKGFKQAHE